MAPTSRPAVLIIAEGAGELADEGYRTFIHRIAETLGQLVPTAVQDIGAPSAAGLLRLGRFWAVLHPRTGREINRRCPDCIVYCSKSSATLAGLFRARLLRHLSRRPVVLVALQPRPLSPPARLLARRLWPDLLLVSTTAERDAAAQLGARVAQIAAGTDLTRFRPPRPGERRALREKWGLPQESRILLHVGHLKRHRNLIDLAPLAGRPDTVVLVVASSHREAASDRLKAELEENGVVVIDRYLPDIEELYRLADCYVFPVTSTDWALAVPLSVIEALASGVPVVTTRFGALPERFAEQPGVRFASGPNLAAAVDAATLDRPPTRHLVDPAYGWETIAGGLLELIEGLAAEPRRQIHPAVLLLPLALLWRQVWKYEETVRSLLWGARLGFDRQPPAAAALTFAGEPSEGHRHEPASVARVGRVGLIDTVPSDTGLTLPVWASRFYGLEVQGSGQSPAQLLEHAHREGWALVAASPRRTARPMDWAAPLRRYVADGGTLLLTVADGDGSALERWSQALECELPSVASPPAGEATVEFPGAGFGFELTGSMVQGVRPPIALYGPVGASVWARLRWESGDRADALVEVGLGRGRVVITGAVDAASHGGIDPLEATQAASALPTLMLFRGLYGQLAWHPPTRLANFTIDDPMLRHGLVGLDYQSALALAKEHDFHVTVATIPRELKLAHQSVVRLLADNPDRISACYHGNDHDGYEFFLAEARHQRFRGRPLFKQRADLRQSADRGWSFTCATGHALDRVMVFPHGLCSAELLPNLPSAGFVATCNAADRFPLGAPRPADPDWGLRPADLSPVGVPLLWRRSLAREPAGFALDLFLGRPAITFGHRRNMGLGFAALVERAQTINRVAQGRVYWRGLEEIARHAYLQRCQPSGGAEVLMTANEACLHNLGPAPRSYLVRRPLAPPGSILTSAGALAVSSRESGALELTIGPRTMATVRLTHPSWARLPTLDRPCTVFSPGPLHA